MTNLQQIIDVIPPCLDLDLTVARSCVQRAGVHRVLLMRKITVLAAREKKTRILIAPLMQLIPVEGKRAFISQFGTCFEKTLLGSHETKSEISRSRLVSETP